MLEFIYSGVFYGAKYISEDILREDIQGLATFLPAKGEISYKRYNIQIFFNFRKNIEILRVLNVLSKFLKIDDYFQNQIFDKIFCKGSKLEVI